MVNQYFMGEPIDSFTFFRIPKVLFVDQAYKDLSTGAKLLYSLMLDRVMLSTLNEWKDKKGRIFIYFTIKEIMREIECCRQTAVNLLDELEKADLIEMCAEHQRRFCGILPDVRDDIAAAELCIGGIGADAVCNSIADGIFSAGNAAQIAERRDDII